jgi:aspartyl-tRNA(Asn)/glutamyl-tRNA(Gln) amidotransferase subunit A
MTPSPAHAPLPPIATLRRQLQDDTRATPHEALVSECLARSQDRAAEHVFTLPLAAQALAAARAADAAHQAGAPLPLLAGLPVTIKDLFDVAGVPTWAGAALRRDAPTPPATEDALAVARLRGAGAALLGKTAMSEFAFSGVGVNPHFGTPRNGADAAVARIPGGSSSGAAVSVALGLAVAGLGSDTGGSIRIPAALNGLVGFKPTQSRVPLQGAFPLAPSLDTVGAITRCVADALLVDGILAGAALAVAARPLSGMRLALPQTLVLDQLEGPVARAFEKALSCLSQAGAQIVPLALPQLAEIGAINSPGGLSPIEAYAIHREAFHQHPERFDPRVAARVALGATVSAADYIRLLEGRRRWVTRTEEALQGFDALVCPTVPLQAPPIQPLLHDDEAFFQTNGLLLRNTFAINFLDGCAFSLPCQGAGELPVGLMLAAPRGHDAALAAVALATEAALSQARLGLAATWPGR